MALIFGLDIANLVNNAISSAGGVGTVTLVKKTQGDLDPNDLLSPPRVVESRYVANGFLENKSDEYKGGTLVRKGGETASILGASLPVDIIPEPGDCIEIQGSTYRIAGVPNRDPASALYQSAVEYLGPIAVAPPVAGRAGAFSSAFSSAFDVYRPA